MKIFGYLDDLLIWTFGLSWYWQVILWTIIAWYYLKWFSYRGDL